MITKEEIIEIIHKREDCLEEWLKNKPEKLSKKTLKNELKKWTREILVAEKLAHDNDPLFPEYSLGTVYTFMNVSSVFSVNFVIALFYIKKLENELSKKIKRS